MPRKNPVPETEKAICCRLLQARTASRLSRVAFAGLVEIPALRLASYELGRVIVPYSVANKAARQLNINQRWLATGELPMRPYFGIIHEVEAEISGRSPFSEVFKDVLEEPIRLRWAGTEMASFYPRQQAIPANAEIHKTWEKLTSPVKELALSMIYVETVQSLARLPDELVDDYERTILDTSWQTACALLSGEKESVDNVTVLDNNSPVPLTLKKILNRAQIVTRERGMKRKLADFLEVAPPRLSLWLHGKQEPGAEAALRMLAWVTAEEAIQNQSAAGAETPATPKTRAVRKQTNENQQPEPQTGSHKRTRKTTRKEK